LLQDEAILSAVHQALSNRCPNSSRRGRPGYPAEVVLRLLVLKHVRNWSYAVLEREVRANLVYRNFTRVGAAKMPDAKTIGRWGTALGPAVIKQIHAVSSSSRGPRRSYPDGGCASTPRWSRPTFIIRPTAA